MSEKKMSIIQLTVLHLLNDPVKYFRTVWEDFAKNFPQK